MSSSIWTLDYSEVFRDIPPLAILVTIIGIAIFMINMFYTTNATEIGRLQRALYLRARAERAGKPL